MTVMFDPTNDTPSMIFTRGQIKVRSNRLNFEDDIFAEKKIFLSHIFQDSKYTFFSTMSHPLKNGK